MKPSAAEAAGTEQKIERLDRILAAAIASFSEEHERVIALEAEMLVLGDERNAAVLDAKENTEIANEFKGLMEQYRQREAEANKALRVAVGLLSTMLPFAGMHPEDVLESIMKECGK